MKNLKQFIPTAIVTLNLTASDSISKLKLMKSALKTTHKITKLIKLSPRHDAIFQKLQADNGFTSESSRVLQGKVLNAWSPLICF
jgi:hypothetical protein